MGPYLELPRLNIDFPTRKRLRCEALLNEETNITEERATFVRRHLSRLPPSEFDNPTLVGVSIPGDGALTRSSDICGPLLPRNDEKPICRVGAGHCNELLNLRDGFR